MEPKQGLTKVSVLVIVVLAVLYAAYFSWFTVRRHAMTNSSRFDLGNIEQVVWNSTHGRLLEMTDPYGTATVSRLAFHADIFLLALVPGYAVLPRPETLLVLQTLALASGGIAVWLLARRRLRPAWLGLIVAGLYFLNPALQWTNIFDVHPVAFATPLILWSAWAAVTRRYRLMIVFAGLAMLTKEEIGLLLPALGVYLWRQHRQPGWGLAMIVGPLVWAIVMLTAVIPSFQSTTAGRKVVYRSAAGTSATAVLRYGLAHPLAFGRLMVSRQSILYGWRLIQPTGGLAIVNPMILGAGPEWLINVLSAKPAQREIVSHYTSGITPWVFLSLIFSLAWLQRKLGSRWPKAWPGLVTAWLIGWGAFSAWSLGPLPGAKYDHSRVVRWRNPYAQPVHRWAEKVPTAAAVSVTNNIGAHFARRQQLYSFPLGVEQSDYVVVLEDHATPVVATQAEVTSAITNLRNDADWQLLEQTGDLTVLRRKE